MIKIYILLFLFVLVISCNSSKNDDAERLTGEYIFTLYDSLNLPLIEGDLNVTEIEDKTVSGTYTVNKLISDDLPLNLSLKKKSFKGTLSGSRLSVNLNPKMADNNIFLVIDLYKDSLSGTWSHSTFIGEKNRGRIKAEKK
jgi:hypothetical protein